MEDWGFICYLLDCCALHRYDSAIIESLTTLILIDILDAVLRYRIDNDGGRDLGKIQIELGLEFSIEDVRIVEY